MPRADPKLRQRIKSNLDAFELRTIEDHGLSAAAVVILIAHCPGTRDAGVLLTRRSSAMSRHSGQYALPGGRLDEGETFIEAAVRELQEELRLSLDRRDILGMLDDYPTRSGFRIRPVVAWAGAVGPIEPDPAEVDGVFCVSLTDLMRVEAPDFDIAPDGCQPVMSAVWPSFGDRLYAPTAAILYQFAEVALRGRPTRVAHYGQPRFAWR